jgi:hypothetical protein
MSFFQFESFMLSMTSLRCDVDIPLVILEISFSRAQRVSIVSPSICQPPSMKLGEYLVRQLSWCPWIWKRPMPTQSELQAIRNLEMPAASHPVLHMNDPLTHDIIANEGSLYAAHVEVQGFEY